MREQTDKKGRGLTMLKGRDDYSMYNKVDNTCRDNLNVKLDLWANSNHFLIKGSVPGCQTNTLKLNWRRRYQGGEVRCPLCGKWEEETLDHFLRQCNGLRHIRARHGVRQVWKKYSYLHD